MQKTKGFTLIELLVVIAIIGILSGLIIVSMSGAQNAAKDARIKSAMDQFRSTAEIYKLNNNNSYGSPVGQASCTSVDTSIITTGTDGAALCADIESQGGSTLAIYITSTAYCLSKILPGGTTWCVDSSGYAGAPAGTCDATPSCN
ncbi:MAG: type II secretion system protein [Candidatus Paceibacterota bacterium]|jgi:prepilin-type N-terminal cleavage/methylation domain-containing protein